MLEEGDEDEGRVNGQRNEDATHGHCVAKRKDRVRVFCRHGTRTWIPFGCGQVCFLSFLFFLLLSLSCSQLYHFQQTAIMTSLTKPLVDIEMTRDTKLGNGRWLSLHEVAFNDPSGTERKWEVCRRIKPAAPGAGSKNEVSGPAVDGNNTYCCQYVSISLYRLSTLTVAR